jgi:DNA-binding NarL/FixJ family response regulator
MTPDAAVLIVRPDETDRSELHRLLGSAGIESRTAGTAREGLAAAREARPGLVLLDVELPDGTGYEACRRLREEHGEWLAIIFVSARRTHALDRIAGLLIGADDYVGVPFDADELIARVRRALTRAGAVAVAAAPAPAPSFTSALTVREQDVLALLATGLTQRAIAADLMISPKTVGTHIQRILVKMGVHSRAGAVALAYRDGLVAAGKGSDARVSAVR